MNFRKVGVITACALMAACGGEGGVGVFVRPGLYVGHQMYNFDLIVPNHHLLWTEDGEVWIVDQIDDSTGIPAYLGKGDAFIGVGRMDAVAQNDGLANFRSRGMITFLSGAARPLETVEASATLAVGEKVVEDFTISNPAESVYTQPIGRSRTLTENIPYSQYRTTFNFDRAALVSDAAGSWRYFNVFGGTTSQAATLKVDATGQFSGDNPGTGCAYQGLLEPHASGKNLFSVNLQLSKCTDAAGKYSGVAYIYTEPDIVYQGGPGGRNIIKVMAIRADKRRAFHLELAPG